MKDLSKYRNLGGIDDSITQSCGFLSRGNSYVAPGLIKHIRKHLPDMSDREKADIYQTIQSIYDNPDYVGAGSGKNGESIEIIKVIDGNLLLAIKVDKENNYNFVSSLYPISDVKLQKRLKAGKLKSISDILGLDNNQEEAFHEVAATLEKDHK